MLKLQNYPNKVNLEFYPEKKSRKNRERPILVFCNGFTVADLYFCLNALQSDITLGPYEEVPEIGVFSTQFSRISHFPF